MGAVANYDRMSYLLPNSRRPYGLHQAVMEPLFILNYETGEIMPWLAETMEGNESLDVWTLNLRDGAEWADGEAFNAEDVVWTINLLQFDMGYAMARFPSMVSELMGRALPGTIGLVGVATLFFFTVGNFLGALLAWTKTPKLVKVLIPMSMIFTSIPPLQAGLLLLYIFGFLLKGFPADLCLRLRFATGIHARIHRQCHPPRFPAGDGDCVGHIRLLVFLGYQFWDTSLALTASSPLNLPPYGLEYQKGKNTILVGVPEHPLGTENSGRDMLALLIVGTPRTIGVGVIAASVGMLAGIFLGFIAGFIGGWVEDVIRLATDITIPSLLVLIVIQSVFGSVDLVTMALLISMFSWATPTRYIRAQVLSMRESGYVQMAWLSGVPVRDIMFKEIMPNLLPYLAASYTGNMTGAIISAVGLEVLGFGPQRIPSLGVAIFFSIEAAALLRNMWWWWGIPTVILVIVFIALLLISLGLDEIANPRLRIAS